MSTHSADIATGFWGLVRGSSAGLFTASAIAATGTVCGLAFSVGRALKIAGWRGGVGQIGRGLYNTPEALRARQELQARACHPDKNLEDAKANAKFQRKKYDEEGEKGVQNGKVKLDEKVFLSFLYGSERFEPWIGELYVDLLLKVILRCATLEFMLRGVDLERFCMVLQLFVTSNGRRRDVVKFEQMLGQTQAEYEAVERSPFFESPELLAALGERPGYQLRACEDAVLPSRQC
eukprot:s93_g10.t1